MEIVDSTIESKYIVTSNDSLGNDLDKEVHL